MTACTVDIKEVLDSLIQAPDLTQRICVLATSDDEEKIQTHKDHELNITNVPPPDLGHSGERPVGRHDGQREAAALVSEDGGGIPGPALRQLHHQLEGRQALQRHHTQTQVRH